MSCGIFSLTEFVDELIETIIEIILSQNRDDVAIIAVYGSRARDDYRPDSDLDLFAVTDKDTDISIKFTFNGIPVDLWSQTWKKIEEISRVDSYWVLPAGTLANCKVVYSRSEQDRERFESIVEETRATGKYYDKHLRKASEMYFGMHQFLGRLTHARHTGEHHDARTACWNLIIYVTYVVAHANGQYLKHNWGKNLSEIYRMDKKPTDLQRIIDSLIVEDDFDNLINLASTLVENTRLFMINQTKGISEKGSLELLQDTGAVEYVNKIVDAAQKKDKKALGYAVHDFQPLVAHDLVKLNNKWDMSSKFRFYSELGTIYDNEFCDFYDSVSSSDFRTVLEQVERMKHKILRYNSQKVPNFGSVSDVKKWKW